MEGGRRKMRKMGAIGLMRPMGLMGLIGLMLLGGCAAEQPEKEEQEMTTISLPITFAFAADNDAATRAPGDPGTYEPFAKPQFAYIYFVAELEDPTNPTDPHTTQVCSFTDNKGDDVSTTNPISLTAANWTETANASEFPQTESYYFKIPENTVKARVYAIASYVELPDLSPTITLNVSTETDVLSMTFNVKNATADISDHLQDLYSTPYNYYKENGDYYGTVDNVYSSTPLNLMLYHVAAKVDVKWNVAQAQQANYVISHVEAKKLKQNNCLLFKPTENTWTTTGTGNDEENNYDKVLMNGDVGQQWYGRQYYYTIPYRDNGNFPIHIEFTKSDGTATPTTNTATYDGSYDLTSGNYAIFAPWVRVDLNFTSDL